MDKGITSKYIKKTASEKRDFKCCKSDVYNRYITKQKHERITIFSWYESCYQRHCLLFPKDISLFLLCSCHLDTYFWTVSSLLSLVDNCLHSQFGNYRFLLIPSTFSDLEFSTALDCIFTIIITEFITTNNSSKTQHPQYHYVTFVIPSNTHSSNYLVHHQYTFLEALYSVI